ncbi:MAG: DMT family transporter [Methylobacteriaceae bacterium]|nr:DMT family transporter [Methylobacteriaceae bacterium]MBV9702680.1 DMT family transporter [Methylobacteriaceae bacterium]
MPPKADRTSVTLTAEETTSPARLALESARPRSIEARSAAERRSRLVGILLFCGALMCFTGTDTSAKWLSRTLPTLEVVWARYFVSAVFVFCAVNPWTSARALATRRPGLQALRSLLLLGSTAMIFLGLKYLQLAEMTAIGFSLPLIVALLAGPLLGEWVGPRRLAAIGIGFAGILIVTRPGSGGFNVAMLYALAGVLCNSLYYIVTRVLAASDPAHTTLAYTSLAGVLVLTPILPFFWVAPPDALSVALIVFMGLCGAMSQWLVILAHHRAPAAILAPFVYVQILWTTGLGYLIFGDVPGLSMLAGAAIVVCSGLYLWYRERVVAAPGEP